MTVEGSDSNFTIFPTNSTLNDLTYKQLVADWWKWNVGIPDDLHPYNEPSNAEKCSNSQKDSIWFLPYALQAEGPKYFQCNIPSDKIILVPLSPTEFDTAGAEGNIKTEQDLEQSLNTMRIATPLDIEHINVTLDGMQINQSKLGEPIRTDFFNVTYPKNYVKFFGETINPGPAKAIAEGIVIFFHDLSVGKHVIKATVIDRYQGEGGIITEDQPPSEAIYEINIIQ